MKKSLFDWTADMFPCTGEHLLFTAEVKEIVKPKKKTNGKDKSRIRPRD